MESDSINHKTQSFDFATAGCAKSARTHTGTHLSGRGGEKRVVRELLVIRRRKLGVCANDSKREQQENDKIESKEFQNRSPTSLDVWKLLSENARRIEGAVSEISKYICCFPQCHKWHDRRNEDVASAVPEGKHRSNDTESIDSPFWHCASISK